MAIISMLRTIALETLERDSYLSTVFPDPARHESILIPAKQKCCAYYLFHEATEQTILPFQASSVFPVSVVTTPRFLQSESSPPPHGDLCTSLARAIQISFVVYPLPGLKLAEIHTGNHCSAGSYPLGVATEWKYLRRNFRVYP